MDGSNLKYCDNCGRPLSLTATECPRCKRGGGSLRTVSQESKTIIGTPAPPVATSRDKIMEAINAALNAPLDARPIVNTCVACGNHNVRPVESICRDESYTTQSFSGHGNHMAMTQHVHISPMARLVAQPRRPAPGAQPRGLRHILVLVVVGGGGVALASAIGVVAVLAVCGVGLAHTLSLYGAILNGDFLTDDGLRDYLDRCVGWRAEMQVWQRLYHCRGCDQVFDPQTGHYASPSQMAALLKAP